MRKLFELLECLERALKNTIPEKRSAECRIVCLLLLFLLIIPVVAIPRANFQTQGTESFKSNNDSLFKGNYIVQYGYSVSIQNYDNTPDTILGNITYGFDADNIIQYDRPEYAQKTGSLIQWVFPDNVTIAENSWLITGAKSDYLYERYIPITVHRTINNSIFSSDGYQLANFSVIFENTTNAYVNTAYNHIWGEIKTSKNSKVNATVLLDSFKTDFPIWEDAYPEDIHKIDFVNKTPVEANRTYYFSVIINVKRIDQSGSPIEYHPGFTVDFDCTDASVDSESSYIANTPAYLLPNYVHYAGGSTNVSNKWSYSRNYMQGFTLNETYNDVENTPIPNFTATPTSGNSPLTVQFSDTSTGSPTSWSWNFGDDSTSTEQNPSHTYTSVGTYTVALTATNAYGSNAKTVANYITVNAASGVDNVGIYRDGVFYRNGADAVVYGLSTDTPVIGDWNGDHISEVGVYRDGVFYRKDATDIVYGLSTDTPIVGDWNGDGVSEVGVYRGGVFYRNGADVIVYGLSTDTPVIGDWNGDHISDVGVYRDGVFYRNGAEAIVYGLSTDTPVIGDWNGDGISEVGVYRGGVFYRNGADAIVYGLSTDTPVIGKWT